MMATDEIEKTVRLPCGPDRAFTLFTAQISAWWPPDRRHTGDPESQLFLHATGRFFERSRAGVEVELGRVLAWEPPHRLLLAFFIGTDADHPTEVEVTFAPADDHSSGTLITIHHRPTPVSQAMWATRAPRYVRSWDLVAEALAAAARV
jgi:uncharacterized protein YndB with AHSA1/START domain